MKKVNLLFPGFFLVLLIHAILISCNNSSEAEPENDIALPPNTYYAHEADSNPNIDGVADEQFWQSCPWDSMKYSWIGQYPDKSDFTGKYKVAWKDSFLFIYAEIVDDKLTDNFTDPLAEYWNDDCLEVFIDEDKSGGDHQYNFNAWAYHISPLINTVDIGPDQKPHLFNNHVNGSMLAHDGLYSWELSIKVFDDTYSIGGKNAARVLKTGETLGFSIAYCDSDTTGARENFMGSVNTDGHYQNLGWINADCFGWLVLK